MHRLDNPLNPTQYRTRERSARRDTSVLCEALIAACLTGSVILLFRGNSRAAEKEQARAH